MKSYLALVPQYERVHRKSSRMSVLCIVFSVLLVTAIFSMADMALRAQKSYFIKTNGEYHASVSGISEETAELIGARLDVAVCGWTYQGSMGMIGSKTVSFAGASEDAFSILTEMELQSGTYPARPDEALLNQTALEQMGLSVGDTVTVALSDGRSKDYHVTGILRDMGSLLKADVYGMVMNEDGFREIADENAKDGTTFRIQFKPGVNIRSAIREIRGAYGLSDRQVAENTALLGLMGQSENSTMQSLYIVATFLILLVLIAGTVMIAASFNTNVLERVQFYGLLRCLGAGKGQVKHFVIRQGLRQSMRGVPIGLIAGQVVTWFACFLLKSVSGDRFSEIPMFQFSISGLLAGVIVGFLIVILASLSPAKKAARVSPITAISGNTQLTEHKKAANTSCLRVDTGMGVFHAVSGKKNLFLMTCSYAISIMMFLSFQVLVVFLGEGMPTLTPSAADLSVTMGSTALDRTLVDQISAMDGVKRVFGRMECAGLAVSSDGGDGTITLVSYDELQLKWAKEELSQGSVSSVQDSSGYVLAVYQDGRNWATGGTLTIRTAAGEQQVIIAGVLPATHSVNGAGSCGYVVCSEQAFLEFVGDTGYTAIDVQFSDTNDDAVVAAIRNLLPADSTVSDKRLSNSESQSAYDTGAIFIYGFLIIVAFITVFNIFNSMNASVASRTKQYGIMRSIGMGADQLRRMIAAEAFTYAVLGCVAGCILGLPLNKLMFQFLIAEKWGTGWTIPVGSLLIIVLTCLASAGIAIRRPIKQISSMAIVDAIKLQQ